jgi:hypothetical protein
MGRTTNERKTNGKRRRSEQRGAKRNCGRVKLGEPLKAKQTTAVGRGANRERGTRKKRRLVQRCARKERQRDQRGEKSAGRGKRYNRNRGALYIDKTFCIVSSEPLKKFKVV